MSQSPFSGLVRKPSVKRREVSIFGGESRPTRLAGFTLRRSERRVVDHFAAGRVIEARMTFRSMLFLKNRTEPSPMAALKPPGVRNRAKNDGAAAGSKSSSTSGLVQGTASAPRPPGSCSKCRR